MEDQETLKARAVELAERANRLRDRATDMDAKARLQDCAEELIKLDNWQRFEAAQSALEAGSQWAEDQRSLAHEINMAWLSQTGQPSMTFDQTLSTLEQWAATYKSSNHPEIRSTGNNLAAALSELAIPGQQTIQKKQALNYLLELFETLLEHLAVKKDKPTSHMHDTVQLLRKMRDAVLVYRELAIDDDELLQTEQLQNGKFDRVTRARQVLDEIYASIQPTSLPK